MTAEEIFARLLKQRGLKQAELKPDYAKSLHDPWLLPDMKPAVQRLQRAVERGETVAIYGDYDIDGLSATALLAEALTRFGLAVETFIPDRFIDGYGLSQRGIDELAGRGATLIITVDTGSVAHEQIKYAQKKSVDVIVTDHHTPEDTLPPAVAVINPKRADSKYPFRDLAGVGVAFKLVQALQQELEGLPPGQEKWLLDLVALGTVCDVVGLQDENRALVYWGLEVMKQSKRPGLRALAHVSASPLEVVDTDVLGFRYGPRLNAAGRIENAYKSLDLLSTRSGAQALDLANTLNGLNYQRRQDQAAIEEQARMLATEHEDDPVLVLANPEWSHGIVGIVAARLMEEFKKPVFLLQIEDGYIKGSARSFGDFHLAEALQAVGQHTLKGGGHAYAAGVTLAPDKLEAFRKSLNDYYQKLELPDQAESLAIHPDIQLDDFTGLDDELIELMRQLAPFGSGNEQPLFQVADVVITAWRPVGTNNKHAKATLQDKSGEKRDAIGFNFAERMPKAGKTAGVTFHVEHNIFNGRKNIQHKLIDVVKT